MSEPTLKQRCLAVAHRFSAFLPEPLEPADADELTVYIEDLVQQQLATVTAERDAHKEMIRKISEGQNPVHVLTQGMSMVIELQQHIATARRTLVEVRTEMDQLKAQLAKMTKRVDELGGFDKDANACERATLESSKEELYSWTMFYMKKVTDLCAKLATMTQERDALLAMRDTDMPHEAVGQGIMHYVNSLKQQLAAAEKRWHDACTHDSDLAQAKEVQQ